MKLCQEHIIGNDVIGSQRLVICKIGRILTRRADGQKQRIEQVIRDTTLLDRVVRDIRLRPYRNVGGDDHELTLRLTLIKFIDKPVISCLVKAGPRIGAVIGIGIRLARVVEDDDLEGHVCLGLKGIGSEVVINIGLGESVARRC